MSIFLSIRVITKKNGLLIFRLETDSFFMSRQPGQLARASGRDFDPPAIRCWVPPSIKSRHNVLKNNDDIVFRKIRGILNKLTPENFSKLCNDLVSLDISTIDRLKGLALLIFQKATDEPKFSFLYARLCKRLDEVLHSFNPSDQPSTFHNLLANTCETEFNNRSQRIDDDKKIYDEEERKSRAKQKVLGNIKFIGELGRLEIVRDAVLFDCIKLLLQEASRSYLPIEERCDNLECMCQLLRICGRRLDSPKGQWLINQVFTQIEKLNNSKNFPKRIRFLLLDIIELRMNNWAPRLVDLIHNKESVPVDLIDGHDICMDNMILTQNRPNALASSNSTTLNGYSYHNSSENTSACSEKFRRNNYSNGNSVRYNTVNGNGSTTNYNNQTNNSRNNFSNFSNNNYQRNNLRNNYNSMKNSNDIAPRFKKNLLIASQGNLNDLELRPPADSMLYKQVPVKQSNQNNADNNSIIMMDNLNLNLNKKSEQEIPLTPIIVPPIPITAVTQPATNTKFTKNEKNKQKKEKSLNKNEIVKMSTNLMKNYLLDELTEKKLIEEFKSVKIAEKLYKDVIVNLLMESMINEDDSDRQKAVKLIQKMQKYGIFNKVACINAFEHLCTLFKNRESEKESARKIANILAYSIIEELISIKNISNLTQSGKYYPLFLLIFQQLDKVIDDRDRVLEMFYSIKIDLLQMLPETIRSEEKLADALDKYDLTFLQPLLQIRSQLMKQIKTNLNPQLFFKWIKENVDEMYYTDDSFINVLFTVILQYIVHETSSDVQEASNYLNRYKSILQFFLDDHIDLQVIAIYSLQVYFYIHEYPRGTLLKWFVLMYNLEIIDGEAFLKWRDDINNNYDGKGEALFEVSNWLTSWLEAAIAESDDDDLEMI